MPPPLLALCYGTRPQIIKVSALIEALGARYDLLTVETGQHYDYELNALLHGQLHLRPPDHELESGDAPAGIAIETIQRRAATALALRRPDAVVVVGDTNSTAGSARAAAELGISLIHIEAGLRIRGPATAEELIRREVDGISDLLCAPSAHAVANLVAERVRGRVALTGDIAYDVLLRNIGHLEPSEIPLSPGTPYILATLHRAELVEVTPLLRSVLASLGTLELPVVLSVHPRLQVALDRDDLASGLPGTIHLIPSLGYLQAVSAVRDAAVVVTDSGGLQREAYWLGTPCVTLRDETEWVETVACGANTLVPPDRALDDLAAAVLQSLHPPDRESSQPQPFAYGAGDAGPRIAEAIGRHLG